MATFQADRVRQIKFRTGTESNQQDSFQIIDMAKATFYGEREERDETEAALAQSMHQAKVVEPSEEEIMYNIREITRKQGERDAADRAAREEKKKQRQMDLERLLQRYQNVKSELEAQQNLERIRAERMASSGQWNWGSTTTKAGAQVA